LPAASLGPAFGKTLVVIQIGTLEAINFVFISNSVIYTKLFEFL